LIRNPADFGFRSWIGHWPVLDTKKWDPMRKPGDGSYMEEIRLVDNPRSYQEGLKNIAFEDRSLWDFYRLTSATVLVTKPTYLRVPTPPEYLVFLVSRKTARLQCIIMPRSWSKSDLF
jgi:hypothetical protein